MSYFLFYHDTPLVELVLICCRYKEESMKEYFFVLRMLYSAEDAVNQSQLGALEEFFEFSKREA